MRFDLHGDVHITFGEEMETLLNDASFKNGILEGRFADTMPPPHASRYRHSLELHLQLRGEKLNGQVIAETPDDSVHFALSSYTELRRQTAAQ